ncbi:glycosyl transferase family 11 [Knoellia remsis]|uniref:Glycosyl transferase family 11 n=1 Tax=Knoellia remsis TaxID=407159 RepID=A0A2T0UZ87_9MICO|nr:alpha-1,2-fucosyltransferase [Knoellia remsis]PRY63232.1 glycosyl transferase family 11 [Knoellia remsis]
MKAIVRDAASAVLSPVRRRLGRRDVNWTPDFMGFGNQLYLWCWAHERRGQHPEPRVLINERTRPWLLEIPAFSERFLIEPDEVHFLDQRHDHWAHKQAESGYAQGFSPQARSAFIRDGLMPEPLLAGVTNSDLASDTVLTVNVRRGDYYSVAAHRSWFAIDLAAYVDQAVRRSIVRDGEVQRIHVVSDDQQWCRDHLPFLWAAAEEVTFAPDTDTAAQNFRDICGSRRLVISNSTFSLWGAFVSRTVHGQNPGMIWAPAFFQSTYPPGRCVEYDADFSFVDELPDGWQPQWVLDGRARP